MKVPNGWKRERLVSLTTFLNSGISRPFVEHDIGFPVLRSNNVKWGRLVIDDIKYWHREDPRGANLNLVTPRAGDVLINFVNGSRSELGKAALYNGELSPCIVSTNFFIVRFDPTRYLPRFANLYFQSSGYKKALDKIVGFTGQGSFNKKELGATELLVPPLGEQRRIAEILGAWDEAIEKVQALIQAKQKLKRALMHQLLTPTKRFPQFKGQWRKTELGAVCEFSAGGTPSRSEPRYWANGADRGHAWASIADLRSPIVVATKERITDAGVAKSPAKLVQAGTILMSFKLTIGRVAVAGVPLYTNEAIAAFTPDESVLNRRFLYHALPGAAARGGADKAVKGKTLNREKIEQLILRLPLPDEQEQIAVVLDALDEDLSAVERLAELLTTQKRGLMQKLLTGQIRVNAGDAVN